MGVLHIFLYGRKKGTCFFFLMLDPSFLKYLQGLCKSQLYQAVFSGLEQQRKVDIMPCKSVEESTFKLCICNSTGV